MREWLEIKKKKRYTDGVFFTYYFITMLKKIIFTFLWTIILGNYSFAADSFSIITESDSKDYIGWGKWRNFSTNNNDKITISNADTKNAQFAIESFSLGTPINFIFGAGDGTTLQLWMYDPAKRYPFRWSYNGIEISGDGRWCNIIVGKFYVHEYDVSSNGTVNKAAIDFVQYCEGWTVWLYGSLRYNSTIASSCTSAGSCNWVKKVLGISISTTSTSTTNTTSNNTTAATETNKRELQKMYKKHYKTFSSFMKGEYNLTYRKDFKNVRRYCNTNKLFDTDENSKNILINSACWNTYAEILQNYNDIFVQIGDSIDVDDHSTPTKDDILEMRNHTNYAIKLRKSLLETSTVRADMRMSIWIITAMYIEYIVHNWIFE